MLTKHEALALNTILDRAIYEANDGDPSFHDVEVKHINPFEEQIVPITVYGALPKKGVILCSGSLGNPADHMTAKGIH